MNDSMGSSKKIKVVDRRRFTEDGSPRDDVDPSGSPEPAGEAPSAPLAESDAAPPDLSASTQTRREGPSPPTGATTSQDFVELVAMLAQQAEMIMVGSEELPASPEQSKRLIDYLGALELKTRGNLSAEEQRLLSTIVYELRTMYLQAKQ